MGWSGKRAFADAALFFFFATSHLIIFKLLLFCSVLRFLLTFRVASYAPYLLLHNAGILLSFVSSFRLSHPRGLLVGSSSLVVGKDIVFPAHGFLPVTEDKHVTIVWVLVTSVSFSQLLFLLSL